ncbi:hypothetical protein BGZ57DRAFT_279775 [Hyaloscypha finlandica]|nr:hypothetical protein BGZ57DRAFT_279775 [Hyaloscypha finlandica]
MAEVSNGATAFQTTAHIPIAQLTPLLAAPASRSIKAIVTLTWPYSSKTGSVAFLLSEPDFRLRRTRGQVRVQFSGSSAKEVAKSGIASGDGIILSLDGVEWVHDATVATPGRGVEFELKFTERLLLQFQQEDSQEAKTIDIDHPATEPEVAAPPRIPTPELAISPSAASTEASSGPPDSATKIKGLYDSPAFIKRARTSYGSLFDSDFDPFAEEDGTIPGKGRKRARLSSTWRYSSRSPTPEAEEEVVEPAVTPPELVGKSIPAMIDEGCQTIGLEEGGAAEALASFARQSMNVGRDSYPFLDGTAASNAIPQPEASFENALTTGQPPTFQVQHIDDLERLSTNQIAPQSPHLQPVSSEFLPQVSPLLSRNTLFTANFQSTARVENTQSLPLQSQVAQINSQTAVTDAEDLYRASPTGRRGEQVEVDVPAFHSPLAEINGVEPPVFENHYNAEDQYGHWQSSTHLSHHASPYRVTEAASEDAQEDRFYVEEGGEEVEQYSHNGFPASHAEMLHSHQYPEIDDGLPDQHLSGWGPGAPGVPYPDLQDHGLEDNTALHPQPRSTAMSRSQSGQSQVVDLTESSDEEGEGPVEGALEEDGSQLEDGEDGSLDEQVEQVADVVRSRHFPQRDALEHEEDFDVEGSEGEEQYYDDGLDEGADTIDQRFNVPPGQEFYDEEEEEYESDDEDMEGEGPPRPTGQREPEVIDLLSSDDEDSAPPPQVKPTSSATPRYPQPPSHESETTEVEEDSDSEDSVSYAEREEFRVHKANRNLSREGSIEENDEIMKDEREQDDSEQSVGKTENESEIAAHHERDPARESMVECVDHQHLGDGRRVDNDLANVESAQGEEQPVERDKVVDVIIAEVENRVKTAIPGQFGRSQTSPSKSSVFRRLFNLDGANDEPEEEISYPTLPRDEPSPPASDQQTVSQPSDIFFKQTTNTQLPTPDATQSFGQTISTETSFTSNIEALPLSIEQPQESDTTTIKMETEQVEVVVDTSGPIDVEVEMEQIETTAVTHGAAKIKLADEDIEMGQAEATKTIEQPKSTENEPPEDQVVEETVEIVVEERTVEQEHTLDNLDRESIEPETVQEQIDEQIMEEKLDLHAEEPESIESADIHEQIDEQFTEEEHSLEVAEPESLEPDDVQERIDEQILEDAIELKANDPNPIEIDSTEDAIAVEELDHKSTEDTITVESSPPKQTEGVDIAPKEPEFTIDSPRRSNRRAKPTAIVASTKENVRPTTPTKVDHGSARTRKEPASPRVALDTRAPPKGHDASIELALASLDSPSKQQHDLRKPPVVDLKLRLSRALRTELSEFTALKVLRYHLNQKLDVLAVATATPAEPLRAKNGPRHYQITFNVTDPSVAPSGVTEVQIFRPYKDALPTIQAGDGILLRNFQVMSVKSRGFGLRSVQDEGSSWVVFKDGGEPEVRGPPVEFGDGEKNHVTALRAWYATLDAAAMSKISRANGDKTGTGVGKSIAKAS